jgi:hypothetical protein
MPHSPTYHSTSLPISHTYSYRNASTGRMRVARQAG